MESSGDAQAATGRGERLSEGAGSDRERWEAQGRHMQRRREVEGEREGTGSDRERWKAQAVTGSGGRRREGTGSDRESWGRWEVKGKRRQ